MLRQFVQIHLLLARRRMRAQQVVHQCTQTVGLANNHLRVFALRAVS